MGYIERAENKFLGIKKPSCQAIAANILDDTSLEVYLVFTVFHSFLRII